MMMMGNMGGGSSMSGGGGMGMMNMGGGAMSGGGMSTPSMSMPSMPMGGGMPTDPNMMNMGQGMANPNAMMGMANNGVVAGPIGGLDIYSLLASILNLAVNIFAILLVVALIAWIASFIKQTLSGQGGFNFSLGTRCTCAKCGQTLQQDWNRCPICGEAKPTTAVNYTNAQSV